MYISGLLKYLLFNVSCRCRCMSYCKRGMYTNFKTFLWATSRNKLFLHFCYINVIQNIIHSLSRHKITHLQWILGYCKHTGKWESRADLQLYPKTSNRNTEFILWRYHISYRGGLKNGDAVLPEERSLHS